MNVDARRAFVLCSWFDLVPGTATLYPRGLRAGREYSVRTLEGAARSGGVNTGSPLNWKTGR